MKLPALLFRFEKFTKSFQQESEWVAKRLVIDSIYFPLASSLWGLLIEKKCGSLEWQRKSFFKAIIFHSGTSLFPLFASDVADAFVPRLKGFEGKCFKSSSKNAFAVLFAIHVPLTFPVKINRSCYPISPLKQNRVRWKANNKKDFSLYACCFGIHISMPLSFPISRVIFNCLNCFSEKAKRRK